jgi:hypothetical protein
LTRRGRLGRGVVIIAARDGTHADEHEHREHGAAAPHALRPSTDISSHL